MKGRGLLFQLVNVFLLLLNLVFHLTDVILLRHKPFSFVFHNMHLLYRSRHSFKDKLIDIAPRPGPQVLNNRIRHAIDRRHLFRFQHGKIHVILFLDGKARRLQHGNHIVSSVEIDMGVIQQSQFRIVPVIMQQIQNDIAVRHVRHGDEQFSRGLQQRPRLLQHFQRIANMLQHICNQHAIVPLLLIVLKPGRLLQISFKAVLRIRACNGQALPVDLNDVHCAFQVFFHVFRHISRCTAQFQHSRILRHPRQQLSVGRRHIRRINKHIVFQSKAPLSTIARSQVKRLSDRNGQ